MTAQLESSSDQKPPYIATIFMLVAVALLCFLGTWQLNRAEQKQQRLEQIAQRKDAQSMTLAELLRLQDKRDLPFSITGQLLSDQVFLLDNRIESGQVGYHVLVPVRTNNGLQIVNFGWIKAGQYRDQLPDFTLPAGQHTLHGISMLPSVNPMVSETATLKDKWPVVVQSIDLELLEAFLDEPVLPVVMQLSPQHELGFQRDWVPVVMAPEKHYAYAMQWYGLAVACFVIYFVAIRKKIRKGKKHG